MELRLRLHVLCFLHGRTCEALFRESSERYLTAAEVKAEINKHYSPLDRAQMNKRRKDCRELFNTSWSDLTADDLVRYFHFLEDGIAFSIPFLLINCIEGNFDDTSKPLVILVANKAMNLYLHNIITHVPSYFESSDFKNASVERFEAFLAIVKKILLHSTSRDVCRQEPIQEIVTRHVFRQYGEIRCKKATKLAQLFRQHEFRELAFCASDDEGDVNSFLNTLLSFGYKEGENWKRENGAIVFRTVDSVRNFHASL